MQIVEEFGHPGGGRVHVIVTSVDVTAGLHISDRPRDQGTAEIGGNHAVQGSQARLLVRSGHDVDAGTELFGYLDHEDRVTERSIVSDGIGVGLGVGDVDIPDRDTEHDGPDEVGGGRA